MSEENQITKFINLLEEMGVTHEVGLLSDRTKHITISGGQYGYEIADFYFDDSGTFKSID